MLEDQQGLCGVCSVIMTKPFVDHDHSTGKVRGLLCQKCNILLGMASDDPHRLQAAIVYLERVLASSTVTM